jgi:hypothetical protein
MPDLPICNIPPFLLFTFDRQYSRSDAIDKALELRSASMWRVDGNRVGMAYHIRGE